MTTTRSDEQKPTFHSYLELPVELQQSIGHFLDKADLGKLAQTSRAQWQLYQPEIIQRFFASHHVIQIAGTTDSTFFVTAEGFVYACGENSSGRLGMGDREARIIPTRIPGLSNIKKVVSSVFLSYSGTLWQVQDDVVVPLELPPIIDVKKYLNDHREALIALAQDGSVYVYGYNAHGRLGVGHHPVEFELVPGLENIVSISINWGSAFYLNTEGRAYVAGYNADGQLGLGNQLNRDSPVLVPSISADCSSIKNIWSDGGMTFIQAANGDIYACGQNAKGQLGIGIRSENHITPTLVAQLKNIKKIFLSNKSAYGLTHEGQVFSWGANDKGQLGLGHKLDKSLPTLMSGLPPIVRIEFFDNTVLLLANDGRSYVCGGDINSLPGMEQMPAVSVAPIEVASLCNISRACNGRNVYTFLRRDGVVCGWGDNQSHALGLDDMFCNTLQFIILPPVTRYIYAASPIELLRYANRGSGYLHSMCFDMALSKLSQMQAVEFIEAALPLLTSSRCRQSEQVQSLFPGFELLAYSNAAIQHAYARLLAMFRELSGALRSEQEQQRNFVLMLQKIVAVEEGREEKEEKGEKSRLQEKGSSLLGLRRYGVFVEKLGDLPEDALQSAANILAHRLPVPDLSDGKRKAEDELEDKDRKDKVKKPRY